MGSSLTRRRVVALGALAAAGLPLRGALAQDGTPAVASPSPTGPRVITHALGETEIAGTPARVVALEWSYGEDLLAVWVQPAGVADIEGYNAWVNVEPALAEDVTDVGTRQEPSLESIAELEPDLIIGIQFRHETIYEDLSAIAPTLIFNPYPDDVEFDQYQEMERTFLTIADAVNRRAEAEAVLSSLASRYADLTAQVAEGGMEGASFVLVQAWSDENIPQMRLFLDNSQAVQTMQRVGLENAYEGTPDIYGFNTVGIEALAEVQDANFFYIVQDNDDVFANQLQDDPVWSALAFVKEGRTYALGGDTWTFGGPLSADVMATKTVELITAS